MEYGYKTLILVDNSASVSMGNREIAKETLKYLIKNAPEQDTFALATFTGQTKLLVDFGSAKEAYLDAIDKITYVEKETCLTDVVMRTLTDWREADFAMRNILVFTDGLGAESAIYPIEEVYFKLNESGYPLYVIGLSQQTNEPALRQAASMARISHGTYLSTEFEDSEAEVEKKLTERLLQAMEEKRGLPGKEDLYEKETQESESEAQGVSAQDIDTEEYASGEYLGANEEEVAAKTLIRDSHDATLFLTMGAGLLCVMLLLFFVIRYFGKRGAKSSSQLTEAPERDMGELTLEDLNDPARYFHLQKISRIVIGSNRQEADIALESDADVAPRHCEIERRLGRFFIRDLRTQTGTLLNGERLLYETQLHPADVITIGRSKLLVRMPYE